MLQDFLPNIFVGILFLNASNVDYGRPQKNSGDMASFFPKFHKTSQANNS